MNSRRTVETRGSLSEARIDDGALILEGWAFSAGRPIDSFTVSCGDRLCDDIDISINLPSPYLPEFLQAPVGGISDIHKRMVLPPSAMSQVANCCFRVRISLTGLDEERIKTSIIGVTPLVGRKVGNLMLGFVEPFLPTPPEEFVEFIGGGYHAPSVAMLANMVQWGGLRPHMDVLDAGCGVGRMAYSLAHFLNPASRYEGFDVAKPLIKWCEENITARFPNFTFRSVDIYSKFYNPGGSIQGADFRFPYPDESFDFVFSTSLFTHLLAEDARRYLDETYRVLRPGGRCFHTCFLLNRMSRSMIRAGKSRKNLVHAVGECFTDCPDAPEGAIGFPEHLLLEHVADLGFTVREKYSGDWCGRPERHFIQDVLILEKRPRRGFWFLPRRAG
jgi:SAM-dependent methyltransferase